MAANYMVNVRTHYARLQPDITRVKVYCMIISGSREGCSPLVLARGEANGAVVAGSIEQRLSIPFSDVPDAALSIAYKYKCEANICTEEEECRPIRFISSRYVGVVDKRFRTIDRSRSVYAYVFNPDAPHPAYEDMVGGK